MAAPSFFGSAGTYRDIAEVAADNAQQSADDAATSAAAAAASQAASVVSEGNASDSAAAASNSADAASNSAASATSQATNAATSAGAAAASETAAAASATTAQSWYEQYTSQYYGALAADPSLDPNGNIPDIGDWYFNTALKSGRAFDGTSWNDLVSVVAAYVGSDDFVATAGQTQFQLSTNGNFSMVWQNGDYLPASAWYITESGGIFYLNLNNAAYENDDISIVYLRAADLGQGFTAGAVDSESSTLNYVMASDGVGGAEWKPASGVSKQVNALGSTLNGAVTVDITVSDWHIGTMNGDITIDLSNPKAYTATTIVLVLTTGGYAVTWPAITWLPGSSPPDMPGNNTYMFRLTLMNTTWYGEFIGGQ